MSAEGKYVWTRPENIRLIMLVRENPILYDYNIRGYKNTYTCENMWQEIAKNFPDKNVYEVKKKWGILRTRYRSCKREMIRGRIQKVKWEYHSMLSFLDAVTFTHRNVGKVQIQYEPPNCDTEEINPLEIKKERTCDSGEECSESTSSVSTFNGEKTDTLRTISLRDPKTSNEFFLASLLMDMNKLPDERLRLFKIEVLGNLHKKLTQTSG